MQRVNIRKTIVILSVIVMCSGWIIMLSAGFRNKLLFDTELSHQGDLDNGRISEGLRQEFRKSRIRLSQNAVVSVKETSKEWLIVDHRDNSKEYKEYKVIVMHDKLIIYMNPLLAGIRKWDISAMSRLNPLRYMLHFFLALTHLFVFISPLRYGFQTFLVSTLVFIFLSKRRALNERLCIGIIVFGMLSLCQPFTIALYRCGFHTLLVGTLAFIIVSHTKPDAKIAQIAIQPES